MSGLASNRGLLLALGGAVLAAALFLLVVQPLLLADDGTDVAVPGSAQERSTDRAADTELAAEHEDEPEAAQGSGDEPLPETFEVFTARDPFHQLVPEGDGGGGGTGTAPATPTTNDGTSGDGTSGDGSDSSSDATVGGTTVKLVDVFTEDGVSKVLVDVNGTIHEAAEGEEFAGRFRVLDVSGQCATLLFGDSRFVLCVGEEIRK